MKNKIIHSVVFIISFMGICIFILLLFISRVNADEVYFINSNNVVLNQQEYKFITNMFFEGYQKTMTKEDYNIIFKNNTINASIQSNTSSYQLLSNSYSTSSKKLTIKKACTTNCLITINLEWLVKPSIKSYDLIGAYLDGVTLDSSPVTKLLTSSGSSQSTEKVSSNNGFGFSVKLQDSNSLIISQYFRVSKGGTVYGSYQHAKKDITLSNSKKYTISKSGYGKVFLFNTSTIRDYYDGMTGVNITV